MPLIYLVRHGQTEYNSKQILQGQCDSPLTELGKEQARKAAIELKDHDFTICYHSPLGRTTATSEIILEYHNTEKMPVDDLMEIDLGTWEGMKIDLEDPELKGFMTFWKSPSKYTAEENGGEDFKRLAQRMYSCIESIKEKHSDDEKILLVSHGAAIRSFINPIAGRKIDDFWADPQTEPASISIIRWDSGNSPELLSYSGHDPRILRDIKNT